MIHFHYWKKRFFKRAVLKKKTKLHNLVWLISLWNKRLSLLSTASKAFFCYFYYSLHWFYDTSSSFSSSSVSSSYSISSFLSPSISRTLNLLLIMFYCQKWLCCNYNCLHPITLIKIELFYIYFSRILATGAEQLFCWTPPSSCLQKS